MLLNKKKIFLGTAQFLSNYGATNFIGLKSKKYFFDLLELAGNSGVYNYDTAYNYKSEKLIGEFLGVHKIKNAKICTKFYGLDLNYQSQVRYKIDSCLKNLKQEIYTLFFHNVNDIKYFEKDPEFFLNLTKNYPIKKIGFSIYNPSEIKNIKEKQKICLQIPYNIVNQKFENITKKYKFKSIFVRSLFLQGILVNQIIKKKYQNKFTKKIKDSLSKYFLFLRKKKIDSLEFNMNFISQQKNFNYFIFGFEKKSQLTRILSVKKKNFKKEYFKIANSYFKNLNIDPIKWKYY